MVGTFKGHSDLAPRIFEAGSSADPSTANVKGRFESLRTLRWFCWTVTSTYLPEGQRAPMRRTERREFVGLLHSNLYVRALPEIFALVWQRLPV